ncbi:hypothetical protein GT93_11895 [Pseudomonas plecoglossicida]|jgi:hypothetical protein|nr:hypothetical protein GT93_11895 [Pseudomonas plecoglossicida]CAH0648405.1 hypothetical protein PSNVIR_02666 [Pseudomonas sp. Nvir]
MLKSLQRIWPEYNITAHGFRATYQTIAHEHLSIDPMVLELSLSHWMPVPSASIRPRAAFESTTRGRDNYGLTILSNYGGMQPMMAQRSIDGLIGEFQRSLCESN